METKIASRTGASTSAHSRHASTETQQPAPPPLNHDHSGPLGTLARLQEDRRPALAQAAETDASRRQIAHARDNGSGSSSRRTRVLPVDIDLEYDRAIEQMEQGGAVHAAGPAPELEAAAVEFPATPTAWAEMLAQEGARPCQRALIAEVLSEIRFGGSDGIGRSHRERLARITPDHVNKWRQGLGLTAQHIVTMERNARNVGAVIPTSSTIFNAINYGMFPWLTQMGSKDPVKNAVVSILAAGLAQPLATAVMQTFVVTQCDTFKKRNGITWMLDPAVNAATTPAQAAAALNTTSLALRAVERQLDGLYLDMARAYNIALAGDKPVEREIAAADSALGEDADVGRRASFNARRNELAGRKRALMIEHSERSDLLCMATSMHDRQSESTRHQRLPRTARSATSFATPVGQTVQRHFGRQSNFPTVAGVVAAVGAMAWQHIASSQDEVDGAFHYEEKQNMLYGLGFMTPAGVSALRAGQTIQPEHIDESGLRRLAPGPATQMRDRVLAHMDAYRRSLGDEPQNLREVTNCVRDTQLLREGRLAELTPGGKAQELLDAVIHHPFLFALVEGREKFGKVEFKGQLIQRMGVAWTMGVAGNVGATAGSRLVNAVLGGARKAPLLAEYSGATLSTAMGYLSAMSNYMAVNVKNELRAAPERVKARWQIFSAVGMPIWQAAQWHARTAAHGHAEHASAGVERFALEDAQPFLPEEN